MERLKKHLLESLDTSRVKSVLDVGTGRGDFISILVDIFNSDTNIMGIDVKDAYLDMARDYIKASNVQFKEMNAYDMDFLDDSFDIVCISNTLHHVENPVKVLTEMKRVLKPDGYLLVNEMFRDNQSKKQMSHVILHHLGASIDMLNDTYHRITYKRDEIIGLINELKFNNYTTLEYYRDQDQTEDRDKEKNVLNSIFEKLDNNIDKISDTEKKEDVKYLYNAHKKNIIKNGIFSSTELLVICK